MSNDDQVPPPAAEHTAWQRMLFDCFARVTQAVHETVEGLDPDTLERRITPTANSIAWLVWHLTRVEDDHLSKLAGVEQVWTSAGWESRFGLGLDVGDLGFGHHPDDVARVRATPDLLRGYYDAVDASTSRYIESLAESQLQTVIDRSYDPPVTVEVRVVSVVSDCLQHAGQAALLRGAFQAGWTTAEG